MNNVLDPIHTWHVFYIVPDKIIRQMVVIRGETIYDVLRVTESEFAGKDVEILGVVRKPLRVEVGER